MIKTKHGYALLLAMPLVPVLRCKRASPSLVARDSSLGQERTSEDAKKSHPPYMHESAHFIRKLRGHRTENRGQTRDK